MMEKKTHKGMVDAKQGREGETAESNRDRGIMQQASKLRGCNFLSFFFLHLLLYAVSTMLLHMKSILIYGWT